LAVFTVELMMPSHSGTNNTKQYSRSNKGYTPLGKSSLLSIGKHLKHNSTIQQLSPKCSKALFYLGHYFCLTTHYAPYALLPITLLYLNDTLHIIPSFVYVLFIAVFFFGIFYQIQDKLLYHPDMPETSRIYVGAPPSNIPCEEIQISTADNIKLHGFFLKQMDEQCKHAPTIVYFHGNAG